MLAQKHKNEYFYFYSQRIQYKYYEPALPSSLDWKEVEQIAHEDQAENALQEDE
jgi:hypothetical protein